MAPRQQQAAPGRGRRLARATAVAATAAVLAVLGRPAAGFLPAAPALSSWQQPPPQQHSPAAAVQREAPASGPAGAAGLGRSGWRQQQQQQPQRQQAGFRLWSATVDRAAEAGERVGSGGGGPADALEAVAAQFEGIYNR